MSRLPTVLIFGSSGMLWSDFIKTQSDKWTIVKPVNPDLDIRNQTSIMKAIWSIKPDFVLNCAAYTRVDDAEDIGAKDNYDINSLAVWYLARACKENGCGFVTISSDYVFDGVKGRYAPDDPPNPINAYGMAKYLGERLALEEYSKTVVVRTSWLYWGNAETKNFVNTMIRLGKLNLEVRVVSDQFGAPTFTYDLCDFLTHVFRASSMYEWAIHHYSNTTENPGGVSWYEFAKEIFSLNYATTRAIPIETSEFHQKAKRPSCSSMSVSAPRELMRNWKESLRTYLGNISCEQG